MHSASLIDAIYLNFRALTADFGEVAPDSIYWLLIALVYIGVGLTIVTTAFDLMGAQLRKLNSSHLKCFAHYAFFSTFCQFLTQSIRAIAKVLARNWLMSLKCAFGSADSSKCTIFSVFSALPIQNASVNTCHFGGQGSRCAR